MGDYFEENVAPGSLLPRAKRLTDYHDPFRFDSIAYFKTLMLESLAHNASDVFVQPNLPICARINGLMVRPGNAGQKGMQQR